MNLDRISDALQNYTGQEDSMRSVTGILQEELGDNWTETVFQDLQSLPPALKENLTHVFNYYAATMAWNETQEYLVNEDLQKTPELEERLPILKHWLDFFGAPGQKAYGELEKRLDEMVPTKPEEDATTLEPNEAAEAGSEDAEEEVLVSAEDDVGGESVSDEEEKTDDTAETPKDEGDPAVFDIEKVQKELSLLDQNQAWLSARCIQLKGIEVFAYPFYGFVVDLMRQALKDMEKVEQDEIAKGLIETHFEGGQEAFNTKKEAIKHDIELAEQNCESATTALISDETDMDEVKRTLGAIDTNDTIEYVGPAPDGFELLDDETPLDESAIKKQYEKIENMDAMTGTVSNVKEENEEKEESKEENTSQTEQKGVQRKLSFSLKRKKPAGDAS